MKLILFILLPFVVQGEVAEVRWSATTPLTWDNFSGPIDETSEYDAWTYSGFNYEYNWSEADGKINWSIRAHSYFDPAQSWVKKNRKSPALLAHEQLHFDIAEMHCRQFKERCAKYKFTSNMDAEIKAIYDEVFGDMLQAQIDYDVESHHHDSEEGQLVWNEFVAEELSRLEYYKASIVKPWE
jgi:hypothetical protein